MGMFLVAVLVGFAVGVISGLFGIGGGTIMVPVFRLGFALSALQATATSLFVIIPTSISGVVGHLRGKTCVVPLGLAAGLGGALTSPVGVYLATISPPWALMLGAGAVITYSSITMFRKAMAAPKANEAASARAAEAARPASATDSGRGQAVAGAAPASAHVPEAAHPAPARASAASAPAEDGFAVQRKHIVIAALIGVAAGVMSGYVGVGGGFLMVPLFLAIIGLPMKKASGTSLVAMPILVLPGVVEQLVWGNVDVVVGIAMAIGTIPGALVGARIMRRVPERSLRFGFAITMICIAIFLVVNEVALSAA